MYNKQSYEIAQKIINLSQKEREEIIRAIQDIDKTVTYTHQAFDRIQYLSHALYPAYKDKN
jgi:hypothetical protein